MLKTQTGNGVLVLKRAWESEYEHTDKCSYGGSYGGSYEL